MYFYIFCIIYYIYISIYHDAVFSNNESKLREERLCSGLSWQVRKRYRRFLLVTFLLLIGSVLCFNNKILAGDGIMHPGDAQWCSVTSQREVQG